jgi:CBS-domain-containing membrane protein
MASADERAQEFVKNHGRRASDIMTRKPVTVGENASLEEIATLLETHRIKRVPVLRDGKLVGIVSRANLLQGIVARQHVAVTSADDQALREKVISALRDSGTQSQFVSVVVSGGVVQLWGAVNTDAERNAVRVAAESVPGVMSVDRQVGVLPPMVQATMWAE